MSGLGWAAAGAALASLVAQTSVAVATDGVWSALAVSSEAFGTATRAASRSEAEQQAMAACRARSRRDACEVRAFTATRCGAVAAWEFRDGNYWQFGHLASFGDTLQTARMQALADCRRRYRGCRVSIAFCNG